MFLINCFLRSSSSLGFLSIFLICLSSLFLALSIAFILPYTLNSSRYLSVTSLILSVSPALLAISSSANIVNSSFLFSKYVPVSAISDGVAITFLASGILGTILPSKSPLRISGTSLNIVSPLRRTNLPAPPDI